MTWNWKFYPLLDASDKKWFWGTSLFNLILLLIFFLVGYHFWASILFFVMWELMICLYYITKDKQHKQKTALREWTDAILFAVVAATLIRTFFFEAYTIPTASMEKTLLVNDFLFVGKCNYGARLPMTPLAIPFIHNKIPGTDLPSYSDWPQTGYHRLPALEDIKRNDIVVFNYPVEGDKMYDDFTFNENNPMDKKVNYVKRCVAVPGDTVMIQESNIYINGQIQKKFKHGQKSIDFRMKDEYLINQFVKFSQQRQENPDVRFMPFNIKALERNKIAHDDIVPTDVKVLTVMSQSFELPNKWRIFIDPERVKVLQEIADIDTIIGTVYDSAGKGDIHVYPRSHKTDWNKDFFGPMYVPKKGDKIALDEINYAIYGKVIRDYEHNTSFEMKDNKYYLDGNEITEYTFKQNYYFMVGDNRHNSSDGRMWGMVPEENIVGKALIIWFSYDKDASGFFSAIRWNRLLKIIHNIDND